MISVLRCLSLNKVLSGSPFILSYTLQLVTLSLRTPSHFSALFRLKRFLFFMCADKRLSQAPQRLVYDSFAGPTERRFHTNPEERTDLQASTREFLNLFDKTIDSRFLGKMGGVDRTPKKATGGKGSRPVSPTAGGSSGEGATSGASQQLIGDATGGFLPSNDNRSQPFLPQPSHMVPHPQFQIAPSIRLDDVLPLIPIFCGKRSEYMALKNSNTAPPDFIEVSDFIVHLERYVQDPALRILAAIKRSAGTAHQAILRIVPPNNNWKIFKNTLLQIYAYPDDLDILRQVNDFRVRGREPGDTFVTWFLRKRAMAEGLDRKIQNNEAFDLEAELRHVTLRFTPPKIYHIVKPIATGWDRARELDRQVQYDRSLGVPEVAIRQEIFGIEEGPVPYVATTTNEQDRLIAVIDRLNERVAQLSLKVGGQSEDENKHRIRSSPRCFKCDKSGHFARDCSSGQGRGKATCFTCGKPGHFARECRRFRPSSPRGGRFTGTCHNCGKRGHIARECRMGRQNQARIRQNNPRRQNYGRGSQRRYSFYGNGVRDAALGGEVRQMAGTKRARFGSVSSLDSKN